MKEILLQKIEKNNQIDKEEKKIHLYTNTIKEGKFSLYFELSNEIISIEHTYLGNTYVDGVYTFYYYGGRKDEDFDELSF